MYEQIKKNVHELPMNRLLVTAFEVCIQEILFYLVFVVQYTMLHRGAAVIVLMTVLSRPINCSVYFMLQVYQ